MQFTFPWQDISAILLSDDWHYPTPGSIWEIEARVSLVGENERILSPNLTTHLIDSKDNTPGDVRCVIWEEVNGDTSNVENVIVRHSAIRGVRLRSTEVIDNERAAWLRSAIGNRTRSFTQGAALDEIRDFQQTLRFIRQRSPRVPEDPLDTWTPPEV